MMHSAIAVGGKEKTRSKIPATNLLPHHRSRTSYYSNDCCGFECHYQFALCYPTANQAERTHRADHKEKRGEDGIHKPPKIFSNPLISRKASHSADAQKASRKLCIGATRVLLNCLWRVMF